MQCSWIASELQTLLYPYLKLVTQFGGYTGWNHLRVDCVTNLAAINIIYIGGEPELE
jgi:hypothetical protein